MKAFFDSIAHAFEAMGVHPVLGAFIAGAVIAFVLFRRSSSDAADPGAHAPGNIALPIDMTLKAGVTHTSKTSLTVNGRDVELPAEVMMHISAGNKVAAIKLLRTATGLDLTAAKQIVDKLAAAPAAR
jgi:hypothetical protein